MLYCFLSNIGKSLLTSPYILFVIPKRFERLTHALEGRCSIQLSYGTYLFTQSRPKPICVYKDSAFIPLRQKFYTFFCPNNKKEYKEKRSIP